LFSIKFSDYSATIDRSTSTFNKTSPLRLFKRPVHFNFFKKPLHFNF